MGEDWLTQALSSRWTIAAAAYLFGLLCGWAIRRGARANAEKADAGGDLRRDDAEAMETASESGEDVPASAKLSALEAEIRQARSILEADAEEHDAMSEILRGIDEAVKRANGRLKHVLKSVKNNKTGQ